MAVKLAYNKMEQFADGNGVPYSGAKLFTYVAGSSTKQTTYTESTGSTPNTNPIVLDSAGRIPQPLWLTTGVSYKFVLSPSTDTDPPASPIWTLDNIAGINDPVSVTVSEWTSGPTPTYVSATSFTLSGDQTSTFHKHRRLKTTNTSGTVYSTIIGTSFAASLTTVTVANDSGTLDSGLSAVSYGLVSAANPSISPEMIYRKASSVAAAATTDIWSTAGDLVHITGAGGPITSFGTAPYAGAEKTLIFDSTPQVTYNATSLVMPGGVNRTMAANDRMVVRADTTTNAIVTQLTLANGLPPASFNGMSVGMRNGTIVQTRSGGAETWAIKTLAGNDPSAADPVTLIIRDQAATTGAYVERQLTAATSLTVPSGSTLGCVNNEAFRIWLVVFDDAGTMRLGVIKATTGSNAAGWTTYPLSAFSIASSTVMSGASNSAQVFYTGTAVTTKPYMVLGYSTWESGLAAVGTWGTAPSRIQPFGLGVPLPGLNVQVARSASSAVATGTTTTPLDDTIPQNTEGDQYLSQAITPSSAANLLVARAKANASHSNAAGTFIAALHQDAVANALAASTILNTGTATAMFMGIEFQFLSALFVSTTLKLRLGKSAAGTLTFNGISAARSMGGVMDSFLEISEVMT